MILLAPLVKSHTNDWQHEIAVSVSRSVAASNHIGNFFALRPEDNRMLYHIRYSQPNTFFRLPGMRNLLLGVYQGYNTRKMSVPVGISQTATLLQYKKFYFDFELGIVFSTIKTRRIDSRFSFTWVIETGFQWDQYKLAIVKRHYSNGDVAKPNWGENFIGLLIAYRFC